MSPATGTRRGALACVAVFLVATCGAHGADGPATLLGPSYPLEVRVSFSAALFHWVDSLAGTSHGKTIELHQRQFEERFGRPDAQDLEVLRRFQAIRGRHAVIALPGRPILGRSAMLGAFLESADLDAALAKLAPDLGPGDTDGLRSCLERFRERYVQIWQDGKVPNRFLSRAREDAARGELDTLLSRVAKFFGVDPFAGGKPRLVLIPVPDGGGTHAEAVGRNLLLEVRPADELKEQAGPIVHENAHFLWHLVPPERGSRLVRVSQQIPSGGAALAVLAEALPTALGQGVAGRRFLGKRWSASSPWYHAGEVDAYGKSLYPVVQAALDTGASLDETLLERMLRLYRPPPPVRSPGPPPRPPTPR